MEQELLESAYNFGWMAKASHEEYNPMRFVLTAFREYGSYDEQFNQSLVLRYTAGYNECPSDWVERSK
ncbi:hypothetical protein KDA_70050 [Dictyobacter alpinus]|uniref:Uncharacterized protein n=1 Tax=Dictyobacter alpinus TaxID=2014873 RepID=A0A402BJJ4_9CHLR|nr:hypothetical protein [Dictyobacter alpinus]GCE31521.1 hypothetical protein KDA_70050 [Dictyobacter alpinus]